MSLGKITIVAAAVAAMTLPLSIGGAQARVHHTHLHHRVLNPVAAGADLAAGAIGTAAAIAGAPFGAGPYAGPGGYYASSTWGDFDCTSATYPGCRPYASKDWGYH